jgi:hypothetical protein
MLWSPRARTPREPVENPATSLFAAPVRTVLLPKSPEKSPFFFSLCYWSKSLKRPPLFLQLFLPFISLFLQLLTRKSLLFFLPFFCCFSSFFFLSFFCSADPKISLFFSSHFSAASLLFLFSLFFPFSAFLFLPQLVSIGPAAACLFLQLILLFLLSFFCCQLCSSSSCCLLFLL